MVTGRVRPPIDPAQVQVYQVAPPGFEEVAQLNTQSGAFTYGEQNKLNSVLSNLRREAAKLGANGVLLVGTESAPGGGNTNVGVSGGSFGRSSHVGVGVGIDISPRRKVAHALAIYVPNPPPPPPAN